MEKYNWSIPLLLNQRKELLNSIYNDSIHNNERNILNLDLSFTEEMLYELLLPIHASKSPYLFKSKKQIEEQITHLFNELLSLYQIQSIKKTSNYFLDHKADTINKNILRKKISLDEQIEIIKKYYSFNKFLAKDIEELFNPTSRRLHIHKGTFSNAFYYANGKGYIYNRNKEIFDDFASLCHELGHNHEYILTNNRLDIKYYTEDENHLFFYQEIYSIFYELLSPYFLQKEKIITEEEKYNFHNHTFQVNAKKVDKFIECYLIFKEACMDSNDVKTIRKLKSSLENISIYYYSYLIAVNLFEQFLKDEEKALYNLNYLLNNITPENEEQILKYVDASPNNLKYIIKHTNPFLKKRNN